MSFLDRFKRKAQDPNAPDAEVDPNAPKSTEGSAPDSALTERERPARKTPESGPTAGAAPEVKRIARKEKAPEPARGGDEGEMTLELGDFLRRIPQAQLKPGTHDAKMPLKFNLSELADRIARGHTTIPLYEIYKRVPAIFGHEVPSGDQTEIRFPWQKVMKLLAEVATATPSSGLSQQSASTLAEKLKSRRAVRNIVPAQAGTAEMKAAAEAKAKPVRESKLKSGIEPAPKKLPQTSAPMPAAASIAPPIAAMEPAPATSADDENATREDLIKARDNARLTAARVKGEYERQLAAAAQDRKLLAEERDRVAAELAKAQKDVQDKAEQVEFEKSVAGRSGENVARLQQERDALQRELNTRDRDRDSLKTELAKAAKPAPLSLVQTGPKVEEVAAERDALQQQVARLSTETDQLREAAAKPAEPDPALVAKLAALTAQMQQAAADSQSRIAALESTHQSTTQELQRERETRTRFEQQLTAAQHGQQQTAAQIEAAQATQKRELEAAVTAATVARDAATARETESARALADAQSKLIALGAAHEKLNGEVAQSKTRLAAEVAAGADRGQQELAAAVQREAELNRSLTELRGQLQQRQDAHKTLESELQQVRSQLNTTSETNAADSERARVERAEWESRAVAQLEADIESYRGRIKATLQERDALAAERDQAAGKATAEREQLTARVLDLEAKLGSASSELERTRSGADASVATLRNEHEQVTRERDEARALAQKSATDLEALRTDHVARLATLKPAEELAALQTKVDEQARTFATVVGERDLLANQVKSLTEQLSTAITTHQQTAGEIHASASELQASLDTARRDQEGLNALLANAREDLEAARADHQKSLTHVIDEREKAVKDAGAIREELARVRSDYENRLKQARTARTEIEQQVANAAREHDAVKTSLAAVTHELESARQQHQSATSSLGAERSRLAGEADALKQEVAKSRAELKTAQEQVTAARNDFEARLAAAAIERGEVESKAASAAKELDAVQRQLKATETNARTEREQAAKAKGDLEGRLAGLFSEREKLTEKVSTLTREADDAQKAHGTAFGTLEQQHRDLQAARDALDAEFSSTRMRNEKSFAEVSAERDSLVAAKADLETRVREANARIVSLEGKVDGLQKDLAAARETASKLDVHASALVTQHAETVETMTGKHQLVLTALTTEKDAAIAKLTAEKAALAATTDDKLAALGTQHQRALATLLADKNKELAALDDRSKKELAALTGDRDRTRSLLSTAEAKIADLTSKLDTSDRESTALAQQMAVTAIAADKKLAEVTGERDRLLVDKKTLSSDLDEARDSHKAQSAVFAREFKAVVKQRDDALLQLEADRKRYEQKGAELAQEKLALDRREEELGARFERDVARLRRERDSIVEQRDSLRRRLEELINQQRRVLDDVAAQASHATRHAEPAPEPPPRARESKPRKEVEANVIDIASAEVVKEHVEFESGLKIPRVRPVIVPPPQVRIL